MAEVGDENRAELCILTRSKSQEVGLNEENVSSSGSETCLSQLPPHGDNYTPDVLNGNDSANKGISIPCKGECNGPSLTISRMGICRDVSSNVWLGSEAQEEWVEVHSRAVGPYTEGQGHNECPVALVNSINVIGSYYQGVGQERTPGESQLGQHDSPPNDVSCSESASPIEHNLPHAVINTIEDEEAALTGGGINGVEQCFVGVTNQSPQSDRSPTLHEVIVVSRPEILVDVKCGGGLTTVSTLSNSDTDPATPALGRQTSCVAATKAATEDSQCSRDAEREIDSQHKGWCSLESLNKTSNSANCPCAAIVTQPIDNSHANHHSTLHRLLYNTSHHNDRQFKKRKGRLRTKGRLLKRLWQRRKSDVVNLEYLAPTGVTSIKMDLVGESSNFLREHGFDSSSLSACTSLLSLSLDGSTEDICLDPGSSQEVSDASVNSTPTHSTSLEGRWLACERRNISRSSWPNIELVSAHKLSIEHVNVTHPNFRDANTSEFPSNHKGSSSQGSPKIAESSFMTSAASDSSINVIQHIKDTSKDIQSIVRPNKLPLPPKKKDIIRKNASLHTTIPCSSSGEHGTHLQEVNGNYCESKMNLRYASGSKPSTPAVEEVHLEMLSPSEEDKRSGMQQTSLSEDKALSSPTYSKDYNSHIPIEPCCMVRCSTCGQIVKTDSNTPSLLSPSDSSTTYASRTQLIQNGLSPITPDSGMPQFSKSVSASDLHPSRHGPMAIPNFPNSYSNSKSETGKREVSQTLMLDMFIISYHRK